VSPKGRESELALSFPRRRGAGIKTASTSAGGGGNPRGFFLAGPPPGRDKQAGDFF